MSLFSGGVENVYIEGKFSVSMKSLCRSPIGVRCLVSRLVTVSHGVCVHCNSWSKVMS